MSPRFWFRRGGKSRSPARATDGRRRRLAFERLENRCLLAGLAELVEDGLAGGGINPGSSDSSPLNLIDVNGTLYFRAFDAANGTELWRINNSTGRAELVEDGLAGGGINPGSESSIPSYLTNFNGTLYFQATDGGNGYELWRVNNNTGQAELVEDGPADGGINPGNADSFPGALTNVNGTLYFRATDITNGIELWRVNNSTGLAQLVEVAFGGGGINPLNANSSPEWLTNVNGTLYFRANDGANGHELWRVNNSTGLAELVEDGVPGGGINPAGDASISYLINVNGTLYFRGKDGSNGYELWRINGTTGLAVMVEDGPVNGGINPGGGSSGPTKLTNFNGTLYFKATDGGNGYELWRVNNTTSQAELVEDAVALGGINPGAASSLPNYLTNVNGTLYFQANDGSNGAELWRVNNTTGKAELVEDAVAGGGINAYGSSDPSRLTNVNGTLYFQATNLANGIELWRVNNTTGKAELVEDAVAGGGINPVGANSTPRFLTNVNGTLYFRANDGTNGEELWRVNNSTGLAELVEDAVAGGGINPAGASANPRYLTNVNGTLYFEARDGANGYELWRVPALSATLSGGNLTVTDNAGVSNSFLLFIIGANLLINDANERFAPPPAGTTLTDSNKTLIVPLSLITGTLFIQGQGGTDSIAIFDTGAADTAVLFPTSGIFDGDGYVVNWSGLETVTANGGPNDTAYLYDSAQNDNFVSTPATSVMVGGGYANTVNNFGAVNGVANVAGFDIATLYDSSAADTFVGNSTSALLIGGGTTRQALTFERVNGVANVGGADTGYLYDAATNDTFVGALADSYFVSSGAFNYLLAFEAVLGVASAGGNDTAYVYGTSGNDSLLGTGTSTQLSSSSHFLHAILFDSVTGVGNGGATDTASLYGSGGNDTFVGNDTTSFLSAPTYFLQVVNFHHVTGVGNGGAADVAQLYDTAGNDVFDGQRGLSLVSTGAGRTYRALNFRTVHFQAVNGGADRADFRDSSDSDSFVGTDGDARLFFSDYDLFAHGLNASDLVRAIRDDATSTGSDTITLTSIDYVFNEIGAWTGP